jgi:uncharacterized protein DUF5994
VTAFRSTSAQHDLRLVFPRSSTADGVPDGGWWPRSRDPATELPPLIAAVTDRLDPVRRIALNTAAWDGRPEIIMTVEVGKFGSTGSASGTCTRSA